MHAGLQRIFRFAPSPNGYLHIGHACSALVNYDLARQTGGKLLLRIEDIDTGRCTPEYEAAIFEDLAWLGIRWVEPVRRQSDHFGDYSCTMEGLAERGLVYPCFCTRSMIAETLAAMPDWPRDPDGSPLYPGTCRNLSVAERRKRLDSGLHAALRLNMAEALSEAGQRVGWREQGFSDNEPRDITGEPLVWGDVVLARRDVPASYHIAVVTDDALQGVTDVVRGMDLFSATSLHRLLQILLDLPAPDYHHHPLLRDADGEKLAKSRGSQSIRELRAKGAAPDDIRRMAGLVEALHV